MVVLYLVYYYELINFFRLLQYLCDRIEPRISCELVRGYLDFSPHAWNVIMVKRGESWVRMIVDACHPLDIREETDPEYFCRSMIFQFYVTFFLTDFLVLEAFVYLRGFCIFELASVIVGYFGMKMASF